MKVKRQMHNHISFWCPGCAGPHTLRIEPGPNPWLWNQSSDKPTFSPSILATGVIRCHSYIEEGKIRFLDDCSHNLKGQTVDLPEWPFEHGGEK